MVRPLHHIRAMSRLTMIPQPFVNNKKYAWCVYSPTPPFLPLLTSIPQRILHQRTPLVQLPPHRSAALRGQEEGPPRIPMHQLPRAAQDAEAALKVQLLPRR